jgi:hypothetical protein
MKLVLGFTRADALPFYETYTVTDDLGAVCRGAAEWLERTPDGRMDIGIFEEDGDTLADVELLLAEIRGCLHELGVVRKAADA